MGNLPSVSLLMVSFHGKKIFGYPQTAAKLSQNYSLMRRALLSATIQMVSALFFGHCAR
jgi:hypothetical protein